MLSPRLRRAPRLRPVPGGSGGLTAFATAHVSARDLAEAARYDGPDEDAAWWLATHYHRLRDKFRGDAAQRTSLEREAAAAIIRHARRFMASAEPIRHPRVEPWLEPGRGELLIDASLEALAETLRPTLADLRVRVREPREVDIALMLDTSFSMTGRKLALSAVAAAMLACRAPAQRYAIVLFQSGATVVKPLREALTLPSVVHRLLAGTDFGYTNLEAALRTSLRELDRNRRRGRRVGVILTDGKPTVGGDPLPLAGRFDALHVIMMVDPNMDRAMCHALARRGGGQVYPLEDFARLPRLFQRILRAVSR